MEYITYKNETWKDICDRVNVKYTHDSISLKM